jgi:hypothetical protein
MRKVFVIFAFLAIALLFSVDLLRSNEVDTAKEKRKRRYSE